MRGPDDVSGIPVGTHDVCAVCGKAIVMTQHGWVHLELHQLHFAKPRNVSAYALRYHRHGKTQSNLPGW